MLEYAGVLDPDWHQRLIKVSPPSMEPFFPFDSTIPSQYNGVELIKEESVIPRVKVEGGPTPTASITADPRYFFEGAVPFIIADWVRSKIRGTVRDGLEPSPAEVAKFVYRLVMGLCLLFYKLRLGRVPFHNVFLFSRE